MKFIFLPQHSDDKFVLQNYPFEFFYRSDNAFDNTKLEKKKSELKAIRIFKKNSWYSYAVNELVV